MAFVRASDEYKQIDLTMFPKIYKNNNNLHKKDIVEVFGLVEKRLDNYQLIVNKITKLSE